MQQQISVITLGTTDFDVAKRFYTEGFGWTPAFEMPGIAFFQMNGLVFGIWSADALAEDMNRPASTPGSIALAHNVGSTEEVDSVIAKLVESGAKLLRPGDAPPHGGYRGYVSDPDGHAWEIAWNPAWPIDSEGHVHFSV
jgi:catechol 2,3-dioxygenase-like lactoylglutathione lyase family enzyme